MGYIISERLAKKLSNNGDAHIEDTTVSTDRDGVKLVPVTRLDKMRVDHYRVKTQRKVTV